MQGCRPTNRNEKGYLLLSIMLLITLMLIMLAAEAPRMRQQIKRAKEQELINRGKQYAIAIRKYVHKFGRYPTSLQQLEDTNHLRFLRKQYVDPMTGKANWKLIHQGEAEIKIPQNRNPGLTGSGNPGLKGSTPQGGSQPPSANSGGLNPTTPTGNALTLQGQPGGGNSLGSLNTSNIGNGQQVGGGGIIGVASVSKESGIKEFNDSSEYNQWLFVYDQRLEGAAATFGGSADSGVTVASPSASGTGGTTPSGTAAPGPGSAGTGTGTGTGPGPTPTPNP